MHTIYYSDVPSARETLVTSATVSESLLCAGGGGGRLNSRNDFCVSFTFVFEYNVDGFADIFATNHIQNHSSYI